MNIEHTPITWAESLHDHLIGCFPGANEATSRKLKNAIAKFFQTHFEVWGAAQQISRRETSTRNCPLHQNEGRE